MSGHREDVFFIDLYPEIGVERQSFPHVAIGTVIEVYEMDLSS